MDTTLYDIYKELGVLHIMNASATRDFVREVCEEVEEGPSVQAA